MLRNRTAALVAIAILLLLVVFAPVPGSTQGIRTLHDFAHAPIFGSVAILALLALRASDNERVGATWRQYLLVFALTVFLGGATELAQIPVGRDASWFDLRSDTLGAAAFLSIFAMIDPRLRLGRGARAAAATLAVLLLAIHSTPLATAARAYVQRAEEFPSIGDFARGADSNYFLAPQWAALDSRDLPQPWSAVAGEKALHVTFNDGPWPGLDFFEPAPDWRGYHTLAVDLTNPSDAELVLGFRVNDARHDFRDEDRFNRELRLPARTRLTVRVPLQEIEAAPRGRRMDMQRIADIILFRKTSSTAGDMYLTRMWLE